MYRACCTGAYTCARRCVVSAHGSGVPSLAQPGAHIAWSRAFATFLQLFLHGAERAECIHHVCCAACAAVTVSAFATSHEQFGANAVCTVRGTHTPTVTQRTLIIMPSNPRKHNDRAKDDRNGRHNAETAAAAVLLDIDKDPKLEVTNSIDAVADSSGAGAARHTTQRCQHLNAVRQSIWSNDMRSEQV